MAEHFSWVHSVDRERIARRLNDQRPEALGPLDICLQVNISDEASKSGLSLDDLPALAEAVLAMPTLRLRGLMAIPAPAEGLAAQRAPFEAAVLEGATLVRLGTAIFGARAPR